jgi:hypothetical protein
MIMKQMIIVMFALLLTSLLPFFKPFHEPLRLIYLALIAW